jgi:hypothetical protein
MMTNQRRATSEQTIILQTLREQLDRVYGAVSDLLMSRRGFSEVAKRLTEGVPASRLALATAGITYQSWVAVKIRCQLDTDQRSVSLARILDELVRHPGILRRDRFVATYVRNQHEVEQLSLWAERGNNRFDEIAGVGVRSLSARVILKDRSALRECAETVRVFVNKHVAHHDKIGFEARPVEGSVDAWLDLLGVSRCIDLIESLFVKYWWLVNARAPVGLPDAPQATSLDYADNRDRAE